MNDHPDASTTQCAPLRVLVTICTRGRPILLDACLASVCVQDIPDGVAVEIAVIENNAALTCQPIVEKHALASGLRIHAVHEPELGIPFARTRCGTFAIEQGFDWNLYVDDDETARPGWLSAMVGAARMYDCDVVYGRVVSIYPEGTPSWMVTPEINKRPTGAWLTKAEGHNTMVRARVFHTDGMGLRFDEAMRFTGGSDTDFFSRVHKAGGRIVWVGEAVVYEIVPASRMTVRWQLHRTFRVAVNISVLHEKQRGRAAALWRSLIKGLGRVVGGLVRAPLGGAILFAPDVGKRVAFSAAKQIASGLGSFAFIFGVRPQPYRQVDGG